MTSRLLDSLWQAFERFLPVFRLYCFSLTCLAVLAAKVLHIYSHFLSVPSLQILLFGPTLFLQDAVFLSIAHYLSRPHRNPPVFAVSQVLAAVTRYVMSVYAQVRV